MNLKPYKHPLQFYLLSTLIPWALWFTAGFISYRIHQTIETKFLISILGIAGLITPMIISFVLLQKNQLLKGEFLNRFSFKSIKPVYILVSCLLLLLSILAAQAISLFFGYSSDQFRLSGSFSFRAGLLPACLILIVAPAIEELAWHSYGTDCLRARMNLLATSVLFALFWGIWHLPLSSIKGYYHNNLMETGWIYQLNFILSLFPFVIIINWLYYKTKRNILVCIIFHISAGIFNELFQTHPMSKVIQTALLLIFSIGLLAANPKFFFSKSITE